MTRPLIGRRGSGVLAGCMLLLGTACASSGGARPGDASGPFAEGWRPQTVRLVVQNLNFSDARLYAIRTGSRSILGVVGGKQDAEFVMEWLRSEPLRIEIDLLARPRCSTREMQVDPGDILELQIESVFSVDAVCR